jgi:hyperosmotically inducible periplasmic protein
MRSRKLLIATVAACWAFATGSALAGDDTKKSSQPVTDTVITTKVKAELARDKTTKATDINVETKDGVVMLNGAVASTAEKQKAEADARSVDGVLDVQNNLRVAAK